jgi:aminomethyltransferase
MAESRQTPLFSRHQAAGARLVDFGGWRMPLHYGSQIDEHHAVRGDAGLFDVSHMTVVDVGGSAATSFLRRLLANDVAKLAVTGRGLYGCMLNERGGVIDDLIVYRTGEERYRLVVNAATRDKDLAWLRRVAAGGQVAIEERADAAMLAVQGPQAIARSLPLLPESLRGTVQGFKQFHCCQADGWFVARTGYTGEAGLELILEDPQLAPALWDRLVSAGVRPCGLGARDTLRLEAGLCLYGQDLDEEHSPLASGLGWTVAWEPAERDFVGRQALTAERDAGPAEDLAGLLLEDRGVMRHGQRVTTSPGEGLITSGGFSPTLGRSIALARVPAGAKGECTVAIRGQQRRARLVDPVFVRNGRVLVDTGPAADGNLEKPDE